MRGGKARRQEENCNQLQCVYWLFFEEPEGEKEAVKQVYYYWQHLNSFNQLTKANPEPSQSSSWSFLCISHKTFSLNWVCVDRQNVLFKMFNVIFTSPITLIGATPARVNRETLARLRQLYRLFTSW